MIERQKEILKLIITHTLGVSEKWLRETLNISSKTLASDIKLIQSEYFRFCAQSIHETDGIYTIPLNQKKKAIEYYDSIAKHDYHEGLFFDHNKRRLLILLTLLDQNTVTMEQLSQQFLVAKGSIHNSVHSLFDIVDKFGLDLNISSKGIQLQGREFNLRRLLLFILSTRKNLPMINRYTHFYFTETEINTIKAVRSIIDSFLEAHHLQINSSEYYEMNMYVLTCLHRNSLDKYLDSESPSKYCLEISKRLQHYSIAIKPTELVYIDMLLRQKLNQTEKHEITRHILNIFSKRIHALINLDDFPWDSQSGLFPHLHSILFDKDSIKHDIDVLKHREHMLHKYLSSYVYAKLLLDIIYEQLDISLDEKEHTFLAFHIQATLKKIIDNNKTILIYEESNSLNQIIYYSLLKHYGHRIKLIQCTNMWQIENQISKQHIDLIISTIGLLSYFQETPFLVIDPYLESSSYEKIDKALYLKTSVFEIIEINLEVKENMLILRLDNQTESLMPILKITISKKQIIFSKHTRLSGIYHASFLNITIIVFSEDSSYMSNNLLINSYGKRTF